MLSTGEVRRSRRGTGGTGGICMKKRKGKKISAATCLLVLVTSGVFASTIQSHAVATGIQQYDQTEKVVVQLMDESNHKEIVVTLTKQKASELETVLVSVSKRLRNATSEKEIREIYHDAFSAFQSLGLFTGNLNGERILRLSERPHPVVLSQQMMRASRWKINWNACCFLAGDTTFTTFSGIRTNTLLRIIGYLDNLGFPVSGLYRLFSISWLLDTIKLHSLGMRLLLGQFGIPRDYLAKGWLLTCGLTGLRIWSGEMRGNLGFTDFFEYTGALGFTGIKIIHSRLLRAFYLGTALFVSIKQ
jgi:hypothetical protein